MTRPPLAASAGILLAAALLAASTGCSRDAATGNANANVNKLASTTNAAPSPSGPVDPDAPQQVTFTTEEGVTIAGDLYLPEKASAPAVIALHQWQADRSTYKDFARAMRAAGFVVLAIDGHGFGGSTEGASGKVEPGWVMTDELDAAIDYLKSQPGVDALRIGIVGASYGASNAIMYAADNPADVRSVALLSVGAKYRPELAVEPAFKKYGDRPLLTVAARDDAESAADTERLATANAGPRHRSQIYDAGGHGTDLFKVGALDLVKNFFVETLTGPIVSRGATGATGAGEGGGAEGGGEAPESSNANEAPSANANGNRR